MEPSPWLMIDEIGFECALDMIRASKLMGKYISSHQRYDTVRKISTLYSNVFESSNLASAMMTNFRGHKGEMIDLYC